MVDGGTFNGQTVTAIGIAKAGRIYYEAQSLLTSGSDYADLHDALFQACAGLVGTGASSRLIVSRFATRRSRWRCTSSRRRDSIRMRPFVRPVRFPQPPSSTTSKTVSAASSRAAVSARHAGARSSGTPIPGSAPCMATIPPRDPETRRLRRPPRSRCRRARSCISRTPSVPRSRSRRRRRRYSIDGGTTWLDAGSLFDANGYRGTIATGFSNPLAGRAAFIGTSHGYGSSRLNLSSLAGQSVRFRWRLGVDTSGFDLGWLSTTSASTMSGAGIIGVTPPTGRQGRVGLNVSLTGSGTHFAQGETTASFGAGIAVNSVTVTDATHAIVNITIASNAALGSRDISLTTGSELASALNGFTVAPGRALDVRAKPRSARPVTSGGRNHGYAHLIRRRTDDGGVRRGCHDAQEERHGCRPTHRGDSIAAAPRSRPRCDRHDRRRGRHGARRVPGAPAGLRTPGVCLRRWPAPVSVAGRHQRHPDAQRDRHHDECHRGRDCSRPRVSLRRPMASRFIPTEPGCI